MQEAVLGQKHDFLQAVEKCVQYGQDATSLDLNFTCLLLHRSWVIEQASILPEVDERVEKARLDLMRQIGRLNLEVAEDGQDFGNWHLTSHLKDVKETRDVLLDVQLDAEGLEGHVFYSPQIRHLPIA